jgi:hypothetical protein
MRTEKNQSVDGFTTVASGICTSSDYRVAPMRRCDARPWDRVRSEPGERHRFRSIFESAAIDQPRAQHIKLRISATHPPAQFRLLILSSSGFIFCGNPLNRIGADVLELLTRACR